jgi:beta-phosphoglucomutase family hydrolase
MTNFAVIFDMDGVIVDTNPTHKASLQLFVRKYGYDLDEEQLRQKIYGRTNKEWLVNLFGQMSPEQIKAYGDEKEALFREMYLPLIKPLEGLRNFLQSLQNQQVPMAIGTSAPRANVDFTLQHTQLTDFFSVILDESHVNHGKPNPEIYLKVAEALHYSPQNCIVFEDSISGVEAGLKAGCKVVGVATTHSHEELSHTHLIINDFTEINVADLERLML